ncbi:hypothetical protein [Nostoc sp. NMS4]|uniref:hypothetical protein n=1 Tax=Nostoc sp. NMS4 TaxID=2815390 RepID=UPI0025D8B229|nr:hypothetical protein [Nostoc sp. NMS4]MBN3924017.1 hypothetical protein [Nostoc sp. NMS4]
MNNDELPQTYGTLKDDTPFSQFFPENQVPIISLIPLVPGLGAPECYVIDPKHLTKKQIADLAELVYQKRKPECTSLEMAIQAVESGLPLERKWFSAVTTTDLAEYMKLVD